MKAEVVAKAGEVVREIRGGFDVFDEADGFGGEGGAAGVEFEEPVATLFDAFFEVEAEGFGFGDEFGVDAVKAVLKAFEDVVASGEGFFEGVEAFVEPAEAVGFGAFFEVWYMEVDVGGLTDAVEAADALFEHFGVGGKMVEDEVLAELEVAAFAANFRGEEEAGSVGFGEPGGLAVALDEGHVFVEEGGVDVDEGLQGLVEVEDVLAGLGDNEDFAFGMFAEEGGEPEGAGVGIAGGGGIEGPGMEVALGETGEDGASISEDDAAGAVAVEEILEGGFVAGVGDAVGFFDHGGIAAVFVEVAFEVGVAVGIEEAEAGEVAFGAELLGGGGEEEEPGNGAGDGFDEKVGGAGTFGRPFEMVGFVDDDEIPAGVDGGKGKRGMVEEGLDTGDDEGQFSEGGFFGGGGGVVVEHGEGEGETAEEFDEPLVDKGVGGEDEDAGDFAGEEEAVEDEAGFDGFAEADFVGEEDAGGVAAADFGGDVKLMGEEVDAPAEESANRGAFDTFAEAMGFEAEVESGEGVNVSGGETGVGFVEGLGVLEVGFV